MKLPRSITILRLMFQMIGSILHNEKLLLKGNLARLDELGGVYIKFLQIVVLNLNPQDQENFLELLSVYENSKPDQLDIEGYIKDSNLPNPSRIIHIEDTPFATGSFGQVYRADLVGGEKVILKTLRPSVIRYLNYDLRLLNIVSFIYSLVDRQKMLNFRQVYREFRKTCQQETNYWLEAQAADYYYQQYSNHPVIAIPKTYMDVSSRNIIVQDYIEGISVAKLLAIQSNGVDARQYIKQSLNSDLFLQLYNVGYELLAKAVTGEILHADPHPGNLILLPNNRVAIIDFGMVTELTDNRGAFYELLLQYKDYYKDALAIDEFTLAALKFLAPDLYSAMRQADTILGNDTGDTLLAKFKLATKAIVNEEQASYTVEGLLKQKMIMKVLFFIINKGNRFGLSFDLQSLTMLKAAQTYLTVIGQFDHDAIVIDHVVSDVVAYAQQNFERVISSSSSSLQPSEAVEVLSNWFDKMSRNDPWLMQQIAGGYLE